MPPFGVGPHEIRLLAGIWERHGLGAGCKGNGVGRCRWSLPLLQCWGLGPFKEALAAVVAEEGRVGGPHRRAWRPDQIWVEVCDSGPCCET